ncbi:unnamed protein product [Gongylonema pulchrum]|uniref:Retrovirus-related Pol polyprotein from transposon TNT 1-94 n=1 Tax=Gongylonema pulchrum TaxID=637853 RepID=A0A183CYG0_9BILA|nr:unnamed protein product [Gongylonema pulchrum]
MKNPEKSDRVKLKSLKVSDCMKPFEMWDSNECRKMSCLTSLTGPLQQNRCFIKQIAVVFRYVTKYAFHCDGCCSQGRCTEEEDVQNVKKAEAHLTSRRVELEELDNRTYTSKEVNMYRHFQPEM